MVKPIMLLDVVNCYQFQLVISTHQTAPLNKTLVIEIKNCPILMKFYFKILLLLLSTSLTSQTLLHTNGKAIVDASGDTVILKTMNLGAVSYTHLTLPTT